MDFTKYIEVIRMVAEIQGIDLTKPIGKAEAWIIARILNKVEEMAYFHRLAI